MTRIYGLAALAVVAVPSLASAQVVELTYSPTGAVQALGAPGTNQEAKIRLSPTKPAEAKKLPAELKNPLYGVIKLGPAEAPASYVVVLNDPVSKNSTFYVDANADGDLTNDPKVTSSTSPYKKKDVEYTRRSGSALFEIPYGGAAPRPGRIEFYFLDPADPDRASEMNTLHYYRDYGLSGSVTLGKEKYDAFLSDDLTTGDFRGKTEGKPSGATLYIDLDHNKKFERKPSEAFDIRQPIAIRDQRFDIQGMPADGGKFTLAKVEKEKGGKKAELPQVPPKDLKAGTGVFPFKAKDMSGREVSFPSDYRGKIVLLDFWATWCGPCMGEVPNLVQAYKKYHDKGFEILGVTLDQQNQADKVKSVTKEKGMTWPQIYDGGFWKAEVAVKYSINSIPRAFLVEGDTGKILAEGQSLRGGGLEKAIEEALKDSKDSKPSKKFPK